MADKAHIATDQKLAEMEAHLSAIYDQAEKEIEEKAAAYFKQFEKLDAQKRKLVEDGKLTQEEYDQWRRGKIMHGEHWTSLKARLAEEYANVNRTALAYINGQLPEVYALNYNDIGAALDDKVKGYSFELVDAQTVKSLATSDETLLPYKYLNGVKDVRWNTQKVNASVLQGILQGESIPNLAKRLMSVTQMNKVSAIRNARTAVTGAECRGRQNSYEKATQDGIELKREWIAAIDGRTRHAHRLLDGQLADVDKPFKSELGDIMFPGDPSADPANVYNCRCTIAAKVMGFNKVQVEKTMAEKQVEQPKTRGFVPAKTREEAIAYTERFVDQEKSKYRGNIDFGNMDVSVINDVNRALYDVFEAYDIPTLRNISVMNMREKKWRESNAEAAYGFLSHELYLNGKWYKNAKTIAAHQKEYDDLLQRVFPKLQNAIDALGDKQDYTSRKKRTLWSAMLESGRTNVNTVDTYGTIIHEMGHALDAEIFKFQNTRSTFDIKASMQKYGSKISGYAVESTSEYVAESFAAYWKGETSILDPELLKMFEKHRK
jgi:SPP1 gp7 family putative phage head morphogenesis protein